MSRVSKERVVERIVEELFNEQCFEVIPELFTRDFVNHELDEGREVLKRGYGPWKMWLAELFGAFSDLEFTLLETWEAGDRAVNRVRASGVHSSSLDGIPPTGNKVEANSITILRFEEGRVSERWGVARQLDLLEQLGVLEPRSRPCNFVREHPHGAIAVRKRPDGSTVVSSRDEKGSK